MAFHFTAVLTLSIFSSISIVLCHLIYCRLYTNKLLGQGVFLVCIFIIPLRLIFPIELPFSKTIPVESILPEVVQFLDKQLTVSYFTISLSSIITIVWVVGIFVLVLKDFVCYYRHKKLVFTTAKLKYDVPLTLCKENGNTKKGKKGKRLTVLVSSCAGSPIIFGYLKPVVVLPLFELTPREHEFILCHEINHYKNGDLYIKLILKLIQNVYWWNPICFILGRLSQELLEVRVNKMILSRLGKHEEVEYLECLLKIAKQTNYYRANSYALAFGNVGIDVIAKRFGALVKIKDKNSKKIYLSIILTIVLLLSTVTLSFFVVFEPYMLPSFDFFSITYDNVHLQEENGNYYLYKNNQFHGAFDVIPDSLLNLEIYK